MPTASDAIDAAIREVATGRALVSKIKGKQVRGVDALAALKATALAWLNTHRPFASAVLPTRSSTSDRHSQQS